MSQGIPQMEARSCQIFMIKFRRTQIGSNLKKQDLKYKIPYIFIWTIKSHDKLNVFVKNLPCCKCTCLYVLEKSYFVLWGGISMLK